MADAKQEETVRVESQPIVIIEDLDTPLFEGIDTSVKPLFTVSETARVFFARSASWVRLQEKVGSLILNGERVAKRRRGTSTADDEGARFYTLGDIEQMARALAEHEVLSVTQFRITLEILKLEGHLWKYIPLVDDTPTTEGED